MGLLVEDTWVCKMNTSLHGRNWHTNKKGKWGTRTCLQVYLPLLSFSIHIEQRQENIVLVENVVIYNEKKRKYPLFGVTTIPSFEPKF